MLGRTTGAVLIGVDAHLIEVEVDLGGGVPTIAAVGRPDRAVREGIDRIRAALPHAGFKLPAGRITINLAPAELRKEGSGLDLPIAAGLLLAEGQLPKFDTRDVVFAGELALDGTLRPVRGALSMATAARERGRTKLVVPRESAEQAALVPGLDVFAIEHLAELRAVATGAGTRYVTTDPEKKLAVTGGDADDLADVRGQATARRALEIAAAGGHHLLLKGPPGAGKSMLAKRLRGILPPLAVEEALEVTRVWSAAGLARGLVTARPFRAPHHAVSLAGFAGGGSSLRPGEISLASHGVLFLDELPEFRRDVLESLRQPLEDGAITLVRLRQSATFPARFSLVASMNPCPCGWYGAGDGRCRCSDAEVARYRGRLSGPLLDRFDLVVDVPSLELRRMAGGRAGEPSRTVRERVVAARTRQRERYGPDGPSSNARMDAPAMARHGRTNREAWAFLLDTAERLKLSARGVDRVRRVARTVADLAGEEEVGVRCVAEALQLRG